MIHSKISPAINYGILWHDTLIRNIMLKSRIVEAALDDCANKPLRDPDALLTYLRERIPGDGDPTYVILDEIRVRPLSFSEFMSVFDGPADEGWDEYVVHGGMPLALSNPTRIMNIFKSVKSKDISDKTIASYISYLEDAYLVSKAQRFNIKGNAYIGSPKKYYFEDIGLRNARLGFRQVEENHLMENIVYNELLSRGYNVDPGFLDCLQ